MGIPEGVTLVVGGGFHGKSTLLAAVARGVYNHVPGDGRETVVARADALQLRAEPGRPVERANISPFVDRLPFGKDTGSFSTDNAAGSTSMASNIAEALEAGTSLLVLDEDTAAINFLVRDARMQRLVDDADEPITAFVDVVRSLFEEHRVSTMIATGGLGDYLDVADTVIAMREYRPSVASDRARQVTRALPSQRPREGAHRIGQVTKRSVAPESIDPQRRGKTRIRARGREVIEFGATNIDLAALGQIVDAGQVRAIADLIVYCWHRRYFEDDAALTDAIARGLADAERRGLDTLAPHGESGDYAMPRLHEAAGALNRLRGLRVKQIGG
jgi:predicted ABC-class ATPase